MNTGVGERGRNRTFNLLIKSQLLCQLSYAPTCVGGTANGGHVDYSSARIDLETSDTPIRATVFVRYRRE